jgi:hypothetical protein
MLIQRKSSVSCSSRTAGSSRSNHTEWEKHGMHRSRCGTSSGSPGGRSSIRLASFLVRALQGAPRHQGHNRTHGSHASVWDLATGEELLRLDDFRTSTVRGAWLLGLPNEVRRRAAFVLGIWFVSLLRHQRSQRCSVALLRVGLRSIWGRL